MRHINLLKRQMATRRITRNLSPRAAVKVVNNPVAGNPATNKPYDTLHVAIRTKGRVIYVNPQPDNQSDQVEGIVQSAEPTPIAQSTQSAFSLPERVLVGFWFGWAPQLSMYDIPPEYNVVCVAFFEPDDGGMPRFVPTIPAQELKSGIAYLRSRGTVVLLSLGGAHQGVAIKTADRAVFRQEVINAIETYNFMGIDIDLEGRSITAANNQTVVPSVLRELKEEYQSQGKPFFITMAPEFGKLRGPNATYQPFFSGLGNSYDLVMPQYYNQGLDGIWSNTYNRYISQNNDELKGEFLYELTSAIINGQSNYIQIPAKKLAIGLPASPEAALNGYVSNPSAVAWALGRLEEDGNAIRGLMTWSINQDAANGYKFSRDYAPLIYSQ
jgi:chitinase